MFYWETVRPTAVYRKLVSEEATPFVGFAVDLMRRFMPDADQRTLIVAAAWLVGQCTVFVRHREQLANPPVSLSSDQATIEWLTAHISAWALAGLAHAGGSPDISPGQRTRPEERSPPPTAPGHGKPPPDWAVARLHRASC
jgi:hypothetical protein